jgi:hypothetical protein
MTALQQIIKEAKSIRRKSPKMEWKKAVAQASAIYASKHKGKSPVGKKKVAKKTIKKKAIRKTATKKAVGKYVKTVRKGKITDVIYKRKKIGAVKKSATTMHKDTKSHNVNIRVMSGFNTSILKKLEKAMDEYNMAQGQIILHRGNLKNGIKDPFVKKLNQDILRQNMRLKDELGTHIKELKKLI